MICQNCGEVRGVVCFGDVQGDCELDCALRTADRLRTELAKSAAIVQAAKAWAYAAASETAAAERALLIAVEEAK